MEEKSFSKTFTGTVKQILGTCVSIGCTVNNKTPKEIIKEINEGELVVE